MISRSLRRLAGLWLLALLAAPAASQDMALKDILVDGQDWELVADGFTFTEGPAPDLEGNLYFTDVFKNKIHRINAQGKAEVFVDQSHGANGLMFGPDGKLYACQNGKSRIVAYDKDGKETVVAEGVKSNDIVVNSKGGIYFSDPDNHQVWYISPQGDKQVVDKGLNYPNGLILTKDEGTLVVVDMKSDRMYSYRVEPDGTLKFKQAFYSVRLPEGQRDSGGDGLTVDSAGRIYVATVLGLQVFDPQGRYCGVINKPQKSWLSNVIFAGKDLETLYVTSMNKVFKRQLKAKGFRYATAAK